MPTETLRQQEKHVLGCLCRSVVRVNLRRITISEEILERFSSQSPPQWCKRSRDFHRIYADFRPFAGRSFPSGSICASSRIAAPNLCKSAKTVDEFSGDDHHGANARRGQLTGAGVSTTRLNSPPKTQIVVTTTIPCERL